jgi:hypothetical protein
MAKMKCTHNEGTFHITNVYRGLSLGRAKKIARHYGAVSMVQKAGRVGFYREDSRLVGDFWLGVKFKQSLFVMFPEHK